MPSATALKSKQQYNDKLCKMLEEHDKAFLVHADNVGSRQFMDIRTVRSTCGPLRSHPPNHPHVFRVFGIIRPVEDLQGTSADLPHPHLSPIHPTPPHPRRSAPNPAF